jgi:lysophospholipase L1-like esterase
MPTPATSCGWPGSIPRDRHPGGIYTTGASRAAPTTSTACPRCSAPVFDFAIGGAQARNQNGNLPTWGLPFEVDQFLNVGTQSAIFPTIAPTFTSRDLLAISIGGNDARQFQQITSAGGTPTFTVQTSIDSARTQLDRLVAAGSPTISFLAGNTAQLPEPDVVNNPAAQALRNNFSNTYNAALQQTLAGYASRGIVVHYLDLSSVQDRIRANGAAFGLPNGITCAQTPTNVVSGCAGFFFYVDNLHLSSDGFRVVARYIQRSCRRRSTSARPETFALDSARQFGRTLNSRMDLGSPARRRSARRRRFFVRATASAATSTPAGHRCVRHRHRRRHRRGRNRLWQQRPDRCRGGCHPRQGPLRRRHCPVKGDGVQGGLYAAYGLGPIFAQGHLGYGRTEYDISRAAVIDNLSASPKGQPYHRRRQGRLPRRARRIPGRAGRGDRLCPRQDRRLHRDRRRRASPQRRRPALLGAGRQRRS